MENITESNRLIAEFMDLVFYDDENQYYNAKGGYFVGLELNYDTSWDWLMPVVDKIGKIKSDFEPLSGVSLYSNVGEIYKEVVEFVKRYNAKQAELTPEKKEVYLAFSFKCPYCDSDNINAGRPYFEDVKIFVDVECHACEKEWVDVYSLTDIR